MLRSSARLSCFTTFSRTTCRTLNPQLACYSSGASTSPDAGPSSLPPTPPPTIPLSSKQAHVTSQVKGGRSKAAAASQDSGLSSSPASASKAHTPEYKAKINTRTTVAKSWQGKQKLAHATEHHEKPSAKKEKKKLKSEEKEKLSKLIKRRQEVKEVSIAAKKVGAAKTVQAKTRWKRMTDSQKRDELTRQLRSLLGPELASGIAEDVVKMKGSRRVQAKTESSQAKIPFSLAHSTDQAPLPRRPSRLLDVRPSDRTYSPSSRDRQTADLQPTARRIVHSIPPLKTQVLQDLDPGFEMRPVAKLAHGLDRVLFNPGIHWLQDPRSKVYNYDPVLQKLPEVKDFAFERLPGFVKSSEDNDLRTIAIREGRQYTGSTSSLSGLLSHIYFLVSQDMPVDLTPLSSYYNRQASSFTPGQRMPASVFLTYKDGIYATDSQSVFASNETNVLMWLGHVLEAFLTINPKDFSRYLRDSKHPINDDDPRRQAYRYSQSSKFVMRSQLDGIDPRLPGTGVFDVKTRATVPIRLDLMNWRANSGYVINQQVGPFNSFEREYYDLIRSAFLKYSFQARIGNMDGVIIAYHNTARMFGFQYCSLEEMEERLYGAPGRGDRIFEKCVQILERIYGEATSLYPGKSIRILAEKREKSDHLELYVEPVGNEAATRMTVAEEIESGKAEGSPLPLPELKLLRVSVKHYLGTGAELPVPASDAIRKTDEPWTISCTVEESALPPEAIHQKKKDVLDRQYRSYLLPTGATPTDVEKRWNEYKVNPHSGGTMPEFDASRWAAPSEFITMLRSMAEKDAEETARLERENKYRPKVVHDWVKAVTYSRGTAQAARAVPRTGLRGWSGRKRPSRAPRSRLDRSEEVMDLDQAPIEPTEANTPAACGSEPTLEGHIKQIDLLAEDLDAKASSLEKDADSTGHSSSSGKVNAELHTNDDLLSTSSSIGALSGLSPEQPEAALIAGDHASTKPCDKSSPEKSTASGTTVKYPI